MASRGKRAVYCLSLGIITLFASTGLANALFIAWAHEPLNHTFLTYMPDVGDLYTSGRDLLPSWYWTAIYGTALCATLIAAWRYFLAGRRPPAGGSWRRTLLASAVIAALVATGGYLNYMSPVEEERKHNQALASNLLLHKLLFAMERATFPARESPREDTPLAGIAARVRAALIQDRGHHKYLDDGYPLIKFNYSFSFPGKRVADWTTPEGRRPNVVVILMESFRARDIGAYGSRKGLTPVFDRLAARGWLWENFYAAGVQSIRASLATFCSLYPRLGESISRTDPGLPIRGLPAILRDRGYRTEFYHNGDIGFDNMSILYSNFGFDLVQGRKELDPDNRLDTFGWGFPDMDLAEMLAERLNRQVAESSPLFLAGFTQSHHHPWKIPDEGLKVADETGGEYPRFQNTLHYSDHALGVFFDNLREDVLDSTIFFILADSAQPMGEHHGNYALIKFLYEENVKIPFLVYAPGYIKEPCRFPGVASQVDVMPTLLDMLGIECRNHALGRSLLAKADEPLAYFSSPYFEGWVGLRRGRYKFIRQLTGREFSLFDLETDPGETRNIAVRHPDITATMNRLSMRIMLNQQLLYREKKIWKNIAFK